LAALLPLLPSSCSTLDSHSYYHDGPFINGEPSRDSEFWDDQISRERIEEIIQGYSFKCELNWGDWQLRRGRGSSGDV